MGLAYLFGLDVKANEQTAKVSFKPSTESFTIIAGDWDVSLRCWSQQSP